MYSAAPGEDTSIGMALSAANPHVVSCYRLCNDTERVSPHVYPLHLILHTRIQHCKVLPHLCWVSHGQVTKRRGGRDGRRGTHEDAEPRG